MGPDEGSYTVGALVVPAQKLLCRQLSGGKGGQECTMGAFAAAVPPEPFKGGEPGAGGRQGEPPQPPCRRPDDRFTCISSMGGSRIPRHRDRARRMGVAQGLQPFGHFPTPCAAPEPHDRGARLVVDRTQPLALVGLARGGNPHGLALRAPPGAPGGPPTASAYVSLVKRLAGFQPVTGVCTRRCFTAYAGSGLLIWCGGRLRSRPACVRARRTVAAATRIPVCSARSSTRRGQVQSEHGGPTLRGGRRTAAIKAARAAAVTAEGRPGRGASGKPSRPSAR
jgi:hypothetical protein